MFQKSRAFSSICQYCEARQEFPVPGRLAFPFPVLGFFAAGFCALLPDIQASSRSYLVLSDSIVIVAVVVFGILVKGTFQYIDKPT
jgi:hypothetical protein